MLPTHRTILFTLLFISVPAMAELTKPILPPIEDSSTSVHLSQLSSSLHSPVYATDAGDGSGRLFVVDQVGQVRIVKNGKLQSTPFLDVRSKIVKLVPEYDERGLLGLAFDPNFKKNGFVYTYYTAPPNSGKADFKDPFLNGATPNNQGVVTRWHVDANNPNRVDSSSAKVLLRFDHPNSNHNGGNLAFDRDGFLYLSVGDGGGADDQNGQPTDDGEKSRGKAPGGNGQNLTVPLGKILRIDPRGHNSGNGKYGIPSGNPFVNAGNGTLHEIFAYGLRNPYRFSFDKTNGKLVIADVGQQSVEEIDIGKKGGNYGWHIKEGTFKFDPLDTMTEGIVKANSPGKPSGLIDPVAEYDHTEGSAIVGGFVYHGSKIPSLQGKYVFGDFSADETMPEGQLFDANLKTGQIERLMTNLGNPFSKYFVKGFGEDAKGELYLMATSQAGVAGKGVLFRIDHVSSSGGPAIATAVPLPPAAIAGLPMLGLAILVARRSARRGIA